MAGNGKFEQSMYWPKVRERVKMAMTSYKPEKTIHLNRVTNICKFCILILTF